MLKESNEKKKDKTPDAYDQYCEQYERNNDDLKELVLLLREKKDSFTNSLQQAKQSYEKSKKISLENLDLQQENAYLFQELENLNGTCKYLLSALDTSVTMIGAMDRVLQEQTLCLRNVTKMSKEVKGKFDDVISSLSSATGISKKELQNFSQNTETENTNIIHQTLKF